MSKRLTGDLRERAAADLAAKYRAGASIRTLADQTGRSYGLIRQLLQEARVPLRPRGGARTRTQGASA